MIVSALWVPFRSEALSQASSFFKGIVINPNGWGIGEVVHHGLNVSNLLVLGIMLLVSIVIGVASYKGCKMVDWIRGQKILKRWVPLYALIFAVLIFGIYGPGYDAASFIYDKF